MTITTNDYEALSSKLGDLLDQATEKAGQPKFEFQDLAFSLEEDGEIVGGITGSLVGQNLYISRLAVKEEFQGQDYGSKLMATMERAATQMGAKNFTVTTLSYQAVGFYEKQGYEVFGKQENNPHAGVTKFFLGKEVAE